MTHQIKVGLKDYALSDIGNQMKLFFKVVDRNRDPWITEIDVNINQCTADYVEYVVNKIQSVVKFSFMICGGDTSFAASEIQRRVGNIQWNR